MGMNFGTILKIALEYATFKNRAKYYAEVAERVAETLNDDEARKVATEIRDLYEKLP